MALCDGFKRGGGGEGEGENKVKGAVGRDDVVE